MLLAGFTLSSCATSKLGASGQKKVQGKTCVIIGASSGFGRGMAVYQSQPTGQGVDDGVRRRMKEEKRQRKAKK